MPHDDDRYLKWKRDTQSHWESLCRRCGACCGLLDNDPCIHLLQEKDGHYFCSIYQNRFGLQQTIGGNTFRCVPIEKILQSSWPGKDRCGYVKNDTSCSSISKRLNTI